MSDVRSTFVATKANAVRGAAMNVSERFRNVFGVSEGEYLELEDGDGIWKPCRILFVDSCYTNSTGGETAIIKVARILRSGALSTRSLLIICDRNGKRLRALPRTYQVRRAEQVEA